MHIIWQHVLFLVIAMAKRSAAGKVLSGQNPELMKSLLSFRNVSESHIRKILQKLCEEGERLPSERRFRQQAQQCAHAPLEAMCTDMQLQLPKGKEETIPVAVPELALQYFAQESSAYRTMLHEACSSHGNVLSPVLYFDEATPGNPLQPDVKRKAYLF